MNLSRLITCSVVCVLGVCVPSALSSDVAGGLANWPQWRGRSGQGYSNDTRVPLTWNAKENLLWSTALPGYGNSTPVVWGDRVFLTTASNKSKDRKPAPDERRVVCIRASDGKVLWSEVAYLGKDLESSHNWNGYASASCVTEGAHVYAFFGTPGLFCYDMEGKLVWKHSFGIFTSKANWGTAASPCLFDDLVIQNCDNDGPEALPAHARADEAAPMALVALDKATGTERWRTERNQGRGFGTPVLIPSPNGRLDLVLNGPKGVWAYDPHTGKEIWRCERHDRASKDEKVKFGEPEPVFTHDAAYAASGRPGPFQAIRLGGTGDVSQSHRAWEEPRRVPRDVSSPILWGGRIYFADRDGALLCHDAATGKVLYVQRLGDRSLSSPVAVRGKLLFLLENGETVVVEPGTAYREAGRNKLDDGTSFRASPAIADGRLFLRSQTHLYCIGTK